MTATAVAPSREPASAGDALPSGRALGVLRRGGSLALATQGLKLVLQLGSMSVLARLLTPTDFGLWSLVAPIVSFFLVFRDIGLTAATVNTTDITDAEVSSLFWISVGSGCAIAVVLLGLAPLAASIYGDPRLAETLSVMAGSFVLNSITAQYQALMQRSFRFRALSWIDIGANLTGTAAGVIAAFAGAGYWALIVIPVATQVVQMLASIVVSSWQPRAPAWQPRTGSMLRFGGAITGFNFLNYFARNSDNLLIGKVWGMQTLGYYGRAYSLMMAPLYQVIYPLNQVVVPVLTRMRDDREAYRDTFSQLLSLVALACCPLVTCLLLSRASIVALLLGPGWSAVVPIFLPLACAALVQPVNNCAGWLMLSEGRSRDMFVWGIVGGSLTVVSIVGGLSFGARGVAVSYASTQIAVVSPVLWWFACRRSPVSLAVPMRVVLPAWLACGTSALSFELLRGYGKLPAIGSPIGQIALSFAWVYPVAGTLMACHPRGRALIKTAWATARSLRRGRAA